MLSRKQGFVVEWKEVGRCCEENNGTEGIVKTRVRIKSVRVGWTKCSSGKHRATSSLLARIITRGRGKARLHKSRLRPLQRESVWRVWKPFWDNESTRVVNPFFCFLFPADSKWEELHPGGERPPALQEHSAVAYKDCLYIFGGELGFSAGTETPLWVYNVKVTYHLRPNLSPSLQQACVCRPPPHGARDERGNRRDAARDSSFHDSV